MTHTADRTHIFLISGVLFTVLAGAALHFLFEWSGRLIPTALIAPVNESVWEHLKLLFFPILLFSALEALIRRPGPAFYAARTCGVLAGLAAIPVLFYTGTGITGIHALWADLLLFLVSVILAFSLSHVLEAKIRPGRTALLLSLSALILLVLLFFLLTFFPPALPLFQDPLTGGFGIMEKTAEAASYMETFHRPWNLLKRDVQDYAVRNAACKRKSPVNTRLLR